MKERRKASKPDDQISKPYDQISKPDDQISQPDDQISKQDDQIQQAKSPPKSSARRAGRRPPCHRNSNFSRMMKALDVGKRFAEKLRSGSNMTKSVSQIPKSEGQLTRFAGHLTILCLGFLLATAPHQQMISCTIFSRP